MSRSFYRWNGETFVEIGKSEPTPRVHVIEDTMPLTRHMRDGKHYDSKSKFREVTRAFGCVEVGNDAEPVASKPEPLPPLREDIERAYEQVKWKN